MTTGLDPLARKLVKTLALPLGMLDGRRPGDVVILVYHRIGPGGGEIGVSLPVFERQIQELVRDDRVLTLDRALDGSAGGGAVLSFDDGTRDFHSSVLPILVRYQVPATLYLATAFVDSTPEARPPDWEPLSWTQLREATSTGLVSIGSHTHRHINLARSSERVAEDEMRRSQELVEDRLGLACRHFAFPWGVASPAALRVTRRLFDSAALPAWRTNRRGAIDRFRLGRVPILRSDGRFFFSAKRRGRLNGERFAYQALRRGPWGHA